MTIERLQKYKKNQRELQAIKKSIDKLGEQLSEVEMLSCRVKKSGDEYPYIEERVTIGMQDPEEAEPIKKKMAAKEKRKQELEQELRAVDDFIGQMDDGLDKEVMELIFIDGMTQEEVGDTLHYSQGRISQIINSQVKGAEK